MSEWREFTLGEIGEIFDGPHATPERRDEGPYFLNIASLKNGRLDLTASDHVDEGDFSRWTRRVTPRADDLLFSYETRLGEAALMPEGVRACLGRRMALFRVTHPGVHPRFMLYLWLSPSFKTLIDAHTIHGATVNRIPLSRMDTWRISLPPYEQQRAIAEALGALDDKIEANRKLAATASSLAEAHFRELVATATDAVRLKALLMLEYGKALPAKQREPGDIPVFGSGGVVGHHDEGLVQGPGIIVGRKGSVGTVHWAESDFFPIDTVFYVVPHVGIPMTFLYFALRKQRFGERSTDSAVPGLNRGDAYRSTQMVPSAEALVAFDSKARNLFRLDATLSTENVKLATLRDAILPKLMSGQLRVEEAAELVHS